MIEWDERTRVLLVEGRPWPAERQETSGRTRDVVVTTVPKRGLVAVVRLHRDGTAGIELWKGEPDESDGVAVLAESGFPFAMSHVPLCSCGDRGCGNAGRQLHADPVSSETLLSTLELVRDLRWDSRPAETGQEFWQPEETDEF